MVCTLTKGLNCTLTGGLNCTLTGGLIGTPAGGLIGAPAGGTAIRGMITGNPSGRSTGALRTLRLDKHLGLLTVAEGRHLLEVWSTHRARHVLQVGRLCGHRRPGLGGEGARGGVRRPLGPRLGTRVPGAGSGMSRERRGTWRIVAQPPLGGRGGGRGGGLGRHQLKQVGGLSGCGRLRPPGPGTLGPLIAAARRIAPAPRPLRDGGSGHLPGASEASSRLAHPLVPRGLHV